MPAKATNPYMDAQEREIRERLAEWLAEAVAEGLPDSAIGVERTGNDLILRLAGPAAFGSDRAEIGPAFHDVLNVVVDVLKTYDETLIEITGFTDAKGPMITNLALSLERAEGVAQLLERLGIPEARMVAKGLGPLQPIADNDTPDGRQLNRRVELTIRPLTSKALTATGR